MRTPHPYTYSTRLGKPTLRARILTVLALLHGQPLHYTQLADRLKERRPKRVLEACGALMRQGRLQWDSPGAYRLPGQQRNGARRG
jgi:hypothetical protein